jgi:1A family penicillin-binding protein
MVKKHYKKVLKKAKKFSLKKPIIALLILILIAAAALVSLYMFLIKDLPSPSNLSHNTGSYSSQMFDRHGTLLYTLYSDRNQTFVPIDKIPKQIQEATISIEDKDFYHHGAVDYRGIARAAYSIAVHKQLQGGSTLTQQLVKTSLLTPERTWERKIKEVILAFATEVMYNKNQILEMYLNQVPYGGTSYGVEAASEGFFGKHVTELNLAESAYLAGLPEAPSTFSPYGSHPELGKERQQEVLRKMAEQGYITAKQRDDAIKQDLKFAKITNPIKAPHFVFYVKDLLVKKYGEKRVEQGGLKIYTSLDLQLQEYAQATVAAEIAQLKVNKVGNGAVLVLQPGTGEILAMVGSKDYFDPEHGNVNITLAQLQPGSSIKPINYAVGLTKGYSAATPFVDEPVCFPQASGPAYCPRNYDGKFHGIVNMRDALGNSLNIPAVEMLKLNGLEAMIKTANAMGLETLTDPSRYGLSLTLGGGEVTMLNMATAFSVFANQGYRIDPQPILKITDREGQVVEEYKPPSSPIFGKRVLSSEVSYIISDILADNKARYLEFGPDSALKIDKQHVSVKTGTTNDFRDNWTIGYTPSYLVATWVGNNDHTPMSGLVSGITGAAPIWHEIMTHVLQGKKPEIPQKPPKVVGKYVCGATGQVAPTGQQCSNRYEYFIKDAPKVKTGFTTTEKVWVDKTTNTEAKAGQTDNVEQRDETVFVDPSGQKFCLSCAKPSPAPPPGQ